MVFVYTPESETSGSFYVSVAQDPELRLIEHNRGQTRSTRSGVRWRKIWIEEHVDQQAAIRREREIKGWKSRKRIQELLEDGR